MMTRTCEPCSWLPIPSLGALRVNVGINARVNANERIKGNDDLNCTGEGNVGLYTSHDDCT